MKIALAQSSPIRGKIESNINTHKEFILQAVRLEADIIIFPELSITGYEPTLADELATTPDDIRFDIFQELSDEHDIYICIGVPLRTTDGVTISMLIFQPNESIVVYNKTYLHHSEEKYFISAKNSFPTLQKHPNISFAICYELSVEKHSKEANNRGCTIYIASVVEPMTAIEKSMMKLSKIASNYNMKVLMSNCVGMTGDYDCPGRSSIWNSDGKLISTLNQEIEGLILYDTISNKSISIQ